MAKKLPKLVRIQDVLSGARREFLEKGYDGTSMDRIAASAGMSKGGLYHHFSSKDEILAAINDSYREPMEQAMHKALELPGCADGLHHYIKEYLHYWMSHKAEIQLFLMYMTRAMNNPTMLPSLQNYYDQELSFLETIYTTGMEKGEFVLHDPKSMAIALASALDGIIAYLLAVPDFPLDQVLEVFDRIFVRCLYSQQDGAPR